MFRWKLYGNCAVPGSGWHMVSSPFQTWDLCFFLCYFLLLSPSGPVCFSFHWKGFSSTGDRFDSVVWPVFQDTIFRVKLSRDKGYCCRTMLGVSIFSTHPFLLFIKIKIRTEDFLGSHSFSNQSRTKTETLLFKEPTNFLFLNHHQVLRMMLGVEWRIISFIS